MAMIAQTSTDWQNLTTSPIDSGFLEQNYLARYVECSWELAACKAQQLLFLIFAPILVVMSTIGNSLGLAVMVRKTLRNTATAVFISSLAISDTIAVWTGLSRHFIRKLTAYDIRQYSEWACRFQRFFLYLSLDTSAWILCAISIERFLAVCMPHRHKQLKATSRAWKVVLAIVIIQIIFNSNVFIVYGPQTISKDNSTITIACGFTSNATREYLTVYHGWLAMSVYCIFPSIAMVIFNTLIIVKLVRMNRVFSKRRNGSPIGTRSKINAHSMTRMLLCITFYFIIVTTPVFIFTIFQENLFETEVLTEETSARIELVDAVLTLLLYLNHSINFFLYCIGGKRFRKELMKMLPCCSRQQKMADVKNGRSKMLRTSVKTENSSLSAL